jgi:hypothetical protein
MEENRGVRFELSAWVTSLTHYRKIPVTDLDTLLLYSLAGDFQAIEELKSRYNSRVNSLKEGANLGLSMAYDYTHEILYSSHFGRNKDGLTASLPYLEQLTIEFMPKNIDLGAELLACYWLCGGKNTPTIREVVKHLKKSSYEDELVYCKDTERMCGCLHPKEIMHRKLTTLMGLGTTLLCAGEILSDTTVPSLT